jgi:branched chain amino acid efflux pump
MEASSILADGTARSQEAAHRHRRVVAGARSVLSISIAVAAFAASFGIEAREAGMGIAAPIVMSVTTFAGSAQLAAVSVLGAGGGLAAAIVAAVLLNLRYVAVGISVAPSLRGGRVRRLLEAQLAVDESWAVSQREGRVDRELLIGAGLLLITAWTLGTIAGVLGGRALGNPKDYGLDAMFPALFLALLVGQLRSRRARVSAVAGALIALALTPVLPAGLPIVAALGGAVLALAVRP